jgi:hypothetical protein
MTDSHQTFNGARLLALLVLGACSDGSGESSLAVAMAGSGAAGSSTGAPGAGAGGSGAAGSGTTGSGPSGSGASGAGASGTGHAGTGGAGTSHAGTGAGASGGAGAGGATGDAGAAGGAGSPGAPARTPAVDISLETTMENPNAAPWFNVYRPTDLSATGAPLPVVVWANGGCVRSDFSWAPLFERWAKGGFVVLALAEAPDGSFMTGVPEHGALIDWALERADYADMLDSERIVAAGNSCGGVTALGLAAEDSRVAAVFVLSGSSALAASDGNVMGAITAPIGYVVGGMSEDIASPNAHADFDLMADGIAGMIVNRSSGDHFTVSTDTTVLPQVAEIALNWMDLALYGTPGAFDTLTSTDVCAVCDSGMWMLKSKHLDTLKP